MGELLKLNIQAVNNTSDFNFQLQAYTNLL